MKSFKAEIELHSPGDGRLFLNYWDHNYGDDVVCEVVNGRVMLEYYDEEGITRAESTLQEFLEKVASRVTS